MNEGMTRRRLQPRVCVACRKGKGTYAILGQYWHLACFRKATGKDVVRGKESVR